MAGNPVLDRGVTGMKMRNDGVCLGSNAITLSVLDVQCLYLCLRSDCPRAGLLHLVGKVALCWTVE